MSRRFRRSVEWLMGIGGSLLLIAFWPALDRLFAAHPPALWSAMGAMLVAMFIAQYRQELAKRNDDQP
jgi:hypothetical protein